MAVIATLAFIGLLTPLKLFSGYSEALHNPLSSLSDTPSKEDVKRAISYTAKKYLIDESEFMKVIECESGFRYNAVGDSGKAYSLLQFHKPTFDAFCEGDYYSPRDQLICGASMFQTPALKLHWTCWKTYFSH